MQNNPGTLVALWIHRSDGYQVPWGDWRKSVFYHYGYIPYTMIDAAIQSDSGMFQAHIDQRLAVPTDVTLNLGASEIDASSVLVSVEICIEATGAATTMNLHVLDVLDFTPTSPTWYRNCVRQGFQLGTLTVAPGTCIGVDQPIVFGPDSLARPADIRIAAFVEAPLDIGPGEAYQAAMVAWPLPPTDHPVYANGSESGAPDGWSLVVP